MNYDLERLTALLRPWIGQNIALAGRGESSAWYRGPFSLAEGSAALDLRLGGANLYGFPLGPAEVKASMANGAARIEPLDVAVGKGRIRLAPRVRFAPDPAVLTLPEGPLVERVEINPAMCAQALKYVAPALADAATAKGTFSIDLDKCRIPLKNPKKADIVGRFTVHGITVGSSPLIEQLAVFMNRSAAAQLRRESVVPFQLANGRVSHSNLELVFPDITIRTRGSVGLDQTLNLVAEMPVPQKWTAGNTTLSQALKNQILTVPLRGTLSKPQLDQQVVREYTRQFIQKAAGNILESELNRLLRPQK